MGIKSKQIQQLPSTKSKEPQDWNTRIAPFAKVCLWLALGAALNDIHKDGFIELSLNSSYVKSPLWWCLIFTLSLSHIVYFFIWHFPETYMRISSNPCVHPVDLTFGFVVTGKCIQFCVAVFWYLKVNDFFVEYLMDPELANFESVSYVRLFCGFYFMVFGQWLNSHVWKTLGINGVCYGFKLGRPIPWITSFPFNVGISNPQYVGSTITNLGITMLLLNETSAKAGMLTVCLIWAVFYMFSSYVETYTGKVQGKIE
jgi:hypothetical protein